MSLKSWIGRRWVVRRWKLLLAVVVAFCSIYLATCAVLDPRVSVDQPRVERSMSQAAGYLLGKLEPSGRFVYLVDGAGKPVPRKYNVLRHAGTIYSLSMYYELEPSAELRDGIVRAARYLRDRHVHPVATVPGSRTVFSLPGEEARGHRRAKLGGAGLGLVALTRARALDDSVVSIQELREIAEFILFMQRPDGSFRSKYSEQEAFADDFNSLYYPGEAILGLVSLYEIDRDPRWLEASLRATRSLIDRQRRLRRLPNDHWLMIAIVKLAGVHSEAVDPSVSYDEMLEHAIEVGKRMINDQRGVWLIPGLTGGYAPNGSSSPSATRLEGLLAVYQAMPRGHPARSDFRDSIDDGIRFLLACQNTGGPNAGAFRSAVGERLAGKRWDEVRIDHVQHALSAVIGYAHIAYGL